MSNFSKPPIMKFSLVGFALLAAIPPMVFTVVKGDWGFVLLPCLQAVVITVWCHHTLTGRTGNAFYLTRESALLYLPVFTCMAGFFLWGIILYGVPSAYVYFTSMLGWAGFMGVTQYLLKIRQNNS